MQYNINGDPNNIVIIDTIQHCSLVQEPPPRPSVTLKCYEFLTRLSTLDPVRSPADTHSSAFSEIGSLFSRRESFRAFFLAFVILPWSLRST